MREVRSNRKVLILTPMGVRGWVLQILEEQAAYYRARAAEYDEWFFRQGRYDRGPEANQKWFDEVEEVRTALDHFGPTGDILELACGTGLWTESLLQSQIANLRRRLKEMISLCRSRVGDAPTFIQADLFNWMPDRTYDTIFFVFWISHVPPEHFDAFWEMVRVALKPGGRIFFIDSRFEPSSTATNHTLESAAETTVTRKLNDGSEFKIVKLFYEPEDLEYRLKALGFEANVSFTPTYFLYGSAQKL